VKFFGSEEAVPLLIRQQVSVFFFFSGNAFFLLFFLVEMLFSFSLLVDWIDNWMFLVDVG